MKLFPAAFFIACMCLPILVSAQAPEHELIEFDAPGAGQGPGQGTTPVTIAADGAVAGWYLDSGSVSHGFVRNADGTFAAFDPVGSAGTNPEGINQTHVVVGEYTDAGGVMHGFARSSAGKIVSYDAPGAGKSSGQGTIFAAINASGETAGYFLDSNGAFHSFLLMPNGTFAQIDAPGAGTGTFQGTIVAVSGGISAGGVVAGSYFDENFVAHGFVREPDGTFSEFDAVSDNADTLVFGINSQQTVTGVYQDQTGGLGGFVRTADGTITDVPVPLPKQGSASLGVNSINDAGTVAGYYANSTSLPAARAFDRAMNGKAAHFRAPDAGTADGQGTFPYANNNAGQITGPYIDSGNAYHGFVVQ